jgi:hypothetical protein
MKKSIIYRIIRVAIITLVAIQFLPVEREVPDYEQQGDFLLSSSLDDAHKSVIRKACYDCHSYQTAYPWYAKVAPVSFILQSHINEGREHLNFSVWPSYPPSEKKELLEEAAEEILEGEMPLNSYTWLHGEARLTAGGQQQLAEKLNALAGKQ